MVEEHHDDLSHGISIWFFIGSLLAVYGVIILIANLAPNPSSAESHVILANLHAGIWWGVLMIALGLMYAIVFRPGRTQK